MKELSIDFWVRLAVKINDQQISTKSYDKALAIANTMAFSERVKTYLNINQVTEDGHPQALIDMVKPFFNAGGVFLKVGRRSLNKAVIKLTGVFTPKLYQLKIGDTLYGYTSVVGNTETDIINGIDAALTGVPKVTVTKTANSIEVKYIDDDDAVPIKLVKNLKWDSFEPNSVSGTIVDDFVKIKNQDKDFYHIVLQDRDQDVVKELASYVESNKYVFYTSSADSLNYSDSDEDSGLAGYFNTLAYNRTTCITDKNADTQYVDMGAAGLYASNAPGSITGHFKDFSGLIPSEFESSEYLNIKKKNSPAFAYVEIAKRAFVDATMASSRFIDVQIASDWLVESIKEQWVFSLKREKKLQFTDLGIERLVQDAVLVLQRAQAAPYNIIIPNPIVEQEYVNGVATPTGKVIQPFTVTATPRSLVPEQNRIARNYGDIAISCIFGGAIHTVAASIDINF